MSPDWPCLPRPYPRRDPDLRLAHYAVGASFAVLVAEQLHASGADLVISITSAGQLTSLAQPPYFVLIRAALRDEGTSTHYLPPARWAPAPGRLLTAMTASLPTLLERVIPGRSWTTDAP